MVVDINPRGRRALGLIRVSAQGDREAERFGSPDEQRAVIEAACKREDLDLLDVFSEINVSGRAALGKRPGLGVILERIEAGEADVLVVAYFDRLFRSMKVQAQVAERVDAAGGRILAADIGELSSGTAAGWISSQFLGMMAEYTSRSIGERTKAAQKTAVEVKGRPPFPLIPGLRRTEHGGVELDPVTAPHIRRAFEMRATGISLREIGRYLNANGVERSSLNTSHMMFKNRIVLGEIHYRGWRGSCPALVDQELFDRVQESAGAPRGRFTKSARLLARLDILHCGTCGGRMSATSKRYGDAVYPFYRCTAVDCPKRATVSAPMVERLVVEEVHRLGAGRRGHASHATRARDLRAIATRDEEALKRGLRNLAGMEDEAEARGILAELRTVRDGSRTAAEAAERELSALDVTIDKNWNDMTLAERRMVVRALIEQVSITPGRSPDRIQIRSAALVQQTACNGV